MKKFQFAVLSSLIAVCCTACKSITQRAQMGGIDLPRTEQIYPTELTGRIEAQGTAVTISPSIVKAFGGDTSATVAYNVAVGSALWGRDGTDALIGIKSRIETTDFLGIFESSAVTIKGIGVGVVGVQVIK